MGLQPFESELGIDPASLGQSGRRLFHLALQRVGRRQTPVRLLGAPTGLDRLMVFVEGPSEMTEAELRVTQIRQPQTNPRVAWA